ncbi:MAG: DUF5050 domain-containing protein [Clostridium sp.]
MKKFFPLIFISVFLLIGCEKNQTTSKPNPDTTTSTKPSDDDFHRSFGNTINNMTNVDYDFSYVAEYNDTFYFSNGGETIGLFKQSPNSKSEKLNDDRALDINIYKDHIYYDCDGNLVRVDLDGVSNRKVLATSITDLMISNDTLFYVSYTPGDNENDLSNYQLNKYSLKENKLISSESVLSQGFTLIDEHRYIARNPDILNYVCVNGEKTFPTKNEQHIIEFLGQTEDSLICYVAPPSGYLSFLQLNNDGTTKVLNLPIKSTHLVSKNKVFYANSKGFSYLDLLTGETKILHTTKMDETNHLFEFDDIIYYSDSSGLKKMYDIKNNKLLENFTEPPKPIEKPDPIPEPEVDTKLSDEDLARELILKADKSNIRKGESEGAKLTYLSQSSEEWISLAKSWNINLKGKVLSFELSESHMINQYLVEMDTKRVYRIPNQGMMPAYLVENDKKVEKFEYKQ